MKSISFRRLDLNLLRLLMALHQTRSVSTAAAKLGLSQSATSNALARLRTGLSDPLFVRTRTGMVATAYANSIIPVVAKHVAAIAEVLDKKEAFDIATTDAIFRLSLSDLGESIFLPALASRIFSEAPHARLFNVSMPLPDLMGALERRDVDAAIGILDIKGHGLRSVTLFEERYVVIAGRKARTPADLSQARLAVAAPSATYATSLESILDRAGLSESIALRIRHFGALPDLLQDLDIAAIVPGLYARKLREAGIATILRSTLPIGTYKVKLVWHHNSTSDPGCTWLRAQITDLFSGSASHLGRPR